MPPHSPFGERFCVSQSGIQFWLRSCQARHADETDDVNGWNSRVRRLRVNSLKRPIDTFTAVRPSPVRS